MKRAVALVLLTAACASEPADLSQAPIYEADVSGDLMATAGCQAQKIIEVQRSGELADVALNYEVDWFPTEDGAIVKTRSPRTFVEGIQVSTYTGSGDESFSVSIHAGEEFPGEVAVVALKRCLTELSS